MRILATNGINEELKEQLQENQIELISVKENQTRKKKYDITLVEYPNYEDFLNWITNLKTKLSNVIVITEKAEDKIIYKSNKLGIIDIFQKTNDNKILCERLVEIAKEVQNSEKTT